MDPECPELQQVMCGSIYLIPEAMECESKQ